MSRYVDIKPYENCKIVLHKEDEGVRCRDLPTADVGKVVRCKDCLHYEVCNYHICEETDMTVAECTHFADRSEWVHLPDDGYTFMVRGDIAKSLIIANCRAAEAEKTLEEKK